jgi:hypothetical protein
VFIHGIVGVGGQALLIRRILVEFVKYATHRVHVTSSTAKSQSFRGKLITPSTQMEALPAAAAAPSYTILRIKRKRNEEPLDALGKTLVNSMIIPDG